MTRRLVEVFRAWSGENALSGERISRSTITRAKTTLHPGESPRNRLLNFTISIISSNFLRTPILRNLIFYWSFFPFLQELPPDFTSSWKSQTCRKRSSLWCRPIIIRRKVLQSTPGWWLGSRKLCPGPPRLSSMRKMIVRHTRHCIWMAWMTFLLLRPNRRYKALKWP